MHEIDAGVGLQQIAPGAFAGMRLAGYEQHPQFVAHAVDGHHRAIVDWRQFAFQRRRFDLDDVWAGVGNFQRDADLFAAAHGALAQHIAVASHHDTRAFVADALIVEPIGDGLALADDAETRRGHNGDAAITLVAAAGDQRMDRRVEADTGGIGGNVMHASVGNEKRSGDAIGRNVRQGRGDGGEQPGAVGLAIGLTGLDHAHVEALDLLQPGNQRFARFVGLVVAITEILARTLIDHHCGDGGERRAFLARERGIGKRKQDQGERQNTHGSTARPREQQQRRDDDNRAEAKPQYECRNKRREGDAVLHLIAPTVRSAQGRAPDRPCSCR